MDSGRELVAFNGGNLERFARPVAARKTTPPAAGSEHAVDDHAVEVQVGVESGARYRLLALNAPPINRC